MDRLDVVLADLGQSLGIATLAFTDDECRLETEAAVIDLIADRKRGMIVLSALIADMPDGDRTEVLEYLLDLNTGPTLGGSALGVPLGSDAIMLTDQIGAAELSVEWLRGRLTSFLTAVDVARSHILGPRSGEGESAPDPVRDSGASMMRV